MTQQIGDNLKRESEVESHTVPPPTFGNDGLWIVSETMRLKSQNQSKLTEMFHL